MADIMKQEKQKKRKFHLPLTAWLSYLVVATMLFGSVSLAKYTTSTTDSARARVAKFEVAADDNGNQADKITLSTTTLNDETYTFTVKNTSEVVVRNVITVTNVPKGVDVAFNGGEFVQPDADGTVICVSKDVLGINAEKECTLTFKAHDEYTEVKKYEEKMNIQVRFDQVD